MKWPLSWYVEERCEAPDAHWDALTKNLLGGCVYWSKGVLVGPPELRKLLGDTRKPLFADKEATS